MSEPRMSWQAVVVGDPISSIHIYGVNGALVMSLNSIGSNQVGLDLNDLNGGVYLVHIFTGDKMMVDRIVLSK